MKPFADMYDNPRLTVKESVKGIMLGGSVTLCGVRCSFIATWQDEHVSIAPYNKSMPTWEMMCKLKDLFFYDDEEAYQIHPKKSEYVNIKDNCLHIWGRTSK